MKTAGPIRPGFDQDWAVFYCPGRRLGRAHHFARTPGGFFRSACGLLIDRRFHFFNRGDWTRCERCLLTLAALARKDAG